MMTSAGATILQFDGVPAGIFRARFRLLSALLSEDTPEPVSGIDAASLRSKDPKAWRAFFESEMPAIFRYVRARLANPHESEDLASQIFEEAWRSIGSFEDQGLPPRAWLFGVARNVVAGHRRRLARKPPHLSLEAVTIVTADSATRPELLDLARAISSLDSGHAEVVTLRFLHGLSLRETAGALNTTIDGVKGRQARALLALKEFLDRDGRRPETRSSKKQDRSRAS